MSERIEEYKTDQADEYLTVPKFAMEIGVSERTMRRYFENYSQYFKVKIINGWKQYSKDCLPILKRINEISSAGKRKLDVEKILSAEFPVKTNPAEILDLDNRNFNNSEILSVLREIRDILDDIKKGMIK